MPTIKAGEVDLEYYMEGDGPPLLLIRGFAANCSNWSEPFLHPLHERFTCIRFSNRGTGLSDKPAEPTTIRKMAVDAVALLDALGIERAHVFGVSMGGMIAQEIVLNYPQRVNGLVLGCTTPGGGQRGGCQRRHHRPDHARARSYPGRTGSQGTARHPLARIHRQRRGFPGGYAPPLARGPDPAGHCHPADGGDSRVRHGRAPDAGKDAHAVIHGDADRLLPHDNGALIAGLIEGAEMKTIAGAGHMFFWEQPTESAGAISEFLTRIPQTA